MVLPKVVSLVLNGLYTEELSTVSFSENTSFYVYAGFAQVMLTYGMETAFFRFYNKEANKNSVFTTVLISILTTTLLFAAAIFVFSAPLATLLKLSVNRLYILASVLILDVLVAAPFVYYRILGKAIKFATVKLLALIIYAFFNVFFLVLVPKYNTQLPELLQTEKVNYIFIANLLASGTAFLLVLPIYFKHKWNFDLSLLKKLLSYGLPIMVAGVAFLINESLDKLVLRDYLGKDTMGAYAGCYKLTVFLTLFIQAFRMGVEPFFFNQAKEKNAKATYAVVMKFFVIFASLGMLIVLTFLDELKELLVRDESYWIAISIVPVILLANWCLGVYHSLSVWYKLTDRTSVGMYISIFGAIITILVNYIFIPIYGFMAAAYATLAAYGSMMLISYFLGRKYYNVPYDIVRLLSYLIIALAFSWLTLYKYPELIVLKISVIFAYLGIISIFERNSIKRILNR